MEDLAQLGILVTASFATAFLALLILTRLDLRGAAFRRTILTRPDDPTVLLYDGETLVDATAAAQQLLDSAPMEGGDWARIKSLLTPRFPAFLDRIEDLDELGEISIASADGTARLDISARQGLIRISVVDLEEHGARADINQHSLKALGRELETLRANTDNAPFLAWRQSEDGQITWINRAYLNMVERSKGAEQTRLWPPVSLFDSVLLNQMIGVSESKRLSLLVGETGKQKWFECFCAPVGDEYLFTAVDADAAVSAEGQLRSFMQTLTKTFAHLTIGLAVFDRGRRLTLFNPALTDLTALPADFLTGRPTLFTFLDRLRDKQMMPEPKDYKGWRRRISELEAAAADGSYEETWSLPSGQTYRVTGRPHPDGAVAFLFEDISAEISLTRRFRSELEMGQAVIDCMTEAIAVFSPTGALAMSNKAYAELWGLDTADSLFESGIEDAARHWMSHTAPSPVWGDLREFAVRTHDRAEWSADVRMTDGRGLYCRFVPLPGGSTLVGFAPMDHAAASVPIDLREPA